MDPAIHVSEGHRSDTLDRLQSVTHGDFDRFAEALIINIRVHISWKVKDDRRAKAKTDPIVLTIQTPFGSSKKAKASTLAAENLERVLITETPVKLTTTQSIFR